MARRIDAEDDARDALRSELDDLKIQRIELGDAKNYTGAVTRLLLDNKIEAYTRQLKNG